jgi:hypothetical protein
MAFVDHEFALLSIGQRAPRQRSEAVPVPARRVRRRASGTGGKRRQWRVALVLRGGPAKPRMTAVGRRELRPER